MTPEAQRIAIAEACGAKWHDAPPPQYNPLGAKLACWPQRVIAMRTPNFGRSPMPVGNGYAFWHDIPDYVNDLNAMHEAEKVLTAAQSIRYRQVLWEIMPDEVEPVHFCDAIHATATQRAEAFLRTLGLWK